MYSGIIKSDDFHFLADYRFSSNSFKWVYHAAMSFAKKWLRDHDDITVIRVNFNNDAIMVLNRHIVSIMYLKSSKVLTYWRYNDDVF